MWAFTLLRDGALLSASDDQTVRLWRDEGASCEVITTEGSDYTLACIAELAHELLALGTLEGPIEIWQLGQSPAVYLYNVYNRVICFGYGSRSCVVGMAAQW